MWRFAFACTVFIVLVVGPASAWETWQIWRHRDDLTITGLIKAHTHAAIIVALGLMVLAMAFGFALGVGGG